MMRGVLGDRLPDEEVQAFCDRKIRALDRLIEELMMFKVLPKDYQPKARIYEADAARTAFTAIKKGKEKQGKKLLLTLPTAIGKVNLYSNEFLVHLGWAVTSVIKKDNKIISVPLVREIGLSDPYAWEFIFYAVKNKKIDLSGEEIKSDSDLQRVLLEKGYEIKTHNTGIVVCPGWNELEVTFQDESDVRSYQKIKVGREHPCGVEVAANEPFHRIRCKSCNDAIKTHRGTNRKRAFGRKGDDIFALLEL